jgi:hypothetical protein
MFENSPHHVRGKAASLPAGLKIRAIAFWCLVMQWDVWGGMVAAESLSVPMTSERYLKDSAVTRQEKNGNDEESQNKAVFLFPSGKKRLPYSA